MLARLVLACAVVFATPAITRAAPFEDSMAQRVLACTGCHGAQGRSGPDGYYPRIAGKPAAYLLNQLQNFRDGRRRYAPMKRLLANLDDRFLGEIADHFAALDLPYASPVLRRDGAEQSALGQQLVERGDPARGIAACSACHGPKLTGVAPFIPGLLGLPVDYLNAQLGAWRNGSRRAAAPDCMAQITRRLAPADITAITRWLAAQTVAGSSHPLPSIESLPAGLPLECGSITAAPPAAGSR